MDLSRDDTFEVMGSTWLSLEAEMLNDALREGGVSDKAARQKIVTRFLLDRGVFLDQKWFVVDGQRVHPGLSFTTHPIQPDTQVSDSGTVFLRSSFFSSAEYSGSNALYFFEETSESNEDIEVGAVTCDDEGQAPTPPRAKAARKRPARKKSPGKKKRG